MFAPEQQSTQSRVERSEGFFPCKPHQPCLYATDYKHRKAHYENPTLGVIVTVLKLPRAGLESPTLRLRYMGILQAIYVCDVNHVCAKGIRLGRLELCVSWSHATVNNVWEISILLQAHTRYLCMIIAWPFKILKRLNIALRRFLHNHGNIATDGKPEVRIIPYSYRRTLRLLYSA